jgi:hypothetical protein
MVPPIVQGCKSSLISTAPYFYLEHMKKIANRANNKNQQENIG